MNSPTPREQLAEIIDEDITRQVEQRGIYISTGPYEGEIADAILAAGFRPPAQSITTTDDLDTLPVGAVVVDQWDTAWRRGEVSWFACSRHPDAPARIVLPATVVHTPRNGDTNA